MGLKSNAKKQDLYKIFHFKNGLYQGEMTYREKSGFGVFAWDTGEFYYGLWSKNRMNGRGIIFLPNEIVIKGVFRNDSLHGKAYIMMGGKTMLICEYVSGNLSGEVIRVELDENTDEYTAFNLRTGRRLKGFVMKEEYFMNYDFLRRVNKKKDSEGRFFKTLDFEDGGMFFGLVKGDLPFGVGLFIYPDLKYHSGYYINGLLEGLSRINFGNGDIFEGESIKGKMNGHGFYFNAEKSEWVFGEFKDDECVEVIENGEGFPLADIEKFRYLKHQEFENFIDSETDRINLNLAELIQLSNLDDKVFCTINSEEAIPSSTSTKKENFSKFDRDSILSPSETELSPQHPPDAQKKTLHEFYREANLMKKKKRKRKRKRRENTDKKQHDVSNNDGVKSEMMARTDYFHQAKSESLGGYKRKKKNFNYSMYEENQQYNAFNPIFERKEAPELISPSTQKSKKTVKKRKRSRNKSQSSSKKLSKNRIIKGRKILKPNNGSFLSPESYGRYRKRGDVFFVDEKLEEESNYVDDEEEIDAEFSNSKIQYQNTLGDNEGDFYNSANKGGNHFGKKKDHDRIFGTREEEDTREEYLYKDQSVQTEGSKTIDMANMSPQNRSNSASDQTVSQIYIQGIQSVASMVEELKILISENLKNNPNPEKNSKIKERIKILNRKIYDIVEPCSDDENNDLIDFEYQNQTPDQMASKANTDEPENLILEVENGFVNEPLALEPIIEENELRTSRAEEDLEINALRQEVKSINQGNSARKSNFSGPFNNFCDDSEEAENEEEQDENFRFFTSRYGDSAEEMDPRNSPHKNTNYLQKDDKFSFRDRAWDERQQKRQMEIDYCNDQNLKKLQRLKEIQNQRKMQQLRNYEELKNFENEAYEDTLNDLDYSPINEMSEPSTILVKMNQNSSSKRKKNTYTPKNFTVKIMSKQHSKSQFEDQTVPDSIQTLEISPDNLSPVKNSEYELSLNKPSYERLTYTNTVFSQLDEQNRVKGMVSPQSNFLSNAQNLQNGKFGKDKNFQKTQEKISTFNENQNNLHSFRAKSQDNLIENSNPNCNNDQKSKFSETENLTSKLQNISKSDETTPEDTVRISSENRGGKFKDGKLKNSKEEIVKYIISQQYNSREQTFIPKSHSIKNSDVIQHKLKSSSNPSNRSSDIDFTSKELINDFVVERSNTKFIKIVNDYENNDIISTRQKLLSPPNLPAAPVNSGKNTDQSKQKVGGEMDSEDRSRARNSNQGEENNQGSITENGGEETLDNDHSSNTSQKTQINRMANIPEHQDEDDEYSEEESETSGETEENEVVNEKNDRILLNKRSEILGTPIVQSMYRDDQIEMEGEVPAVSNYSSTPITRVTSTKDITNIKKIVEEIKKVKKLTPNKKEHSFLNTSKSGHFIDCYGVFREFGVEYGVNPYLYPVNDSGFVYVDYS